MLPAILLCKYGLQRAQRWSWVFCWTCAAVCLGQMTQRVSVDSAGAEAFARSGEPYRPAISADGRYVAFVSDSALEAADFNFASDIYVHDRQTGATRLVSLDQNLNPFVNASTFAAISGNGRFVAFENPASVYVHDRDADGNGIFDEMCVGCRSTEIVSLDVNGANGGGMRPALSYDGRYVAFVSFAALVPPEPFWDLDEDVFVRDRVAGTTSCVSIDATGLAGDGRSGWSGVPAISPDGRYLAFESFATNLVGVVGISPSGLDVYRYDAHPDGNGNYAPIGTTERVSVDTGDVNGGDNWSGEYGLSISAYGQYVAFQSHATNLYPPFATLPSAVFLRDMANRVTTLVDVTPAGAQENGSAAYPWVCADLSGAFDGRFVTFETTGNDLGPVDNNICQGSPCFDVYMRDMQGATTLLISANALDQAGNDESSFPGWRTPFAGEASPIFGRRPGDCVFQQRQRSDRGRGRHQPGRGRFRPRIAFVVHAGLSPGRRSGDE